jgi:hypothetical protein
VKFCPAHRVKHRRSVQTHFPAHESMMRILPSTPNVKHRRSVQSHLTFATHESMSRSMIVEPAAKQPVAITTTTFTSQLEPATRQTALSAVVSFQPCMILSRFTDLVDFHCVDFDPKIYTAVLLYFMPIWLKIQILTSSTVTQHCALCD